jgi:hypothetical protein
VPGELVIELQVQKAGSYALWARVRTEAEERAKADSFFVRMDQGEKIDWHMPSAGVWTWGRVAKGVAKTPVTYDLQPGTHRLVVARREPGAQIDCVLLTAEGDTPPTLEAVRNDPLFREAESGTATAPMRIVKLAETPTRLLVRFDAVTPLVVKTDTRKTMDYHGPGAWPVLRADTEAVNPRFATVLLPLPTDTPDPKVTFHPVAGGKDIRIAWADHEDVIHWPDDADLTPTVR